MITKNNIQDIFNNIDTKTLKRFQNSDKEYFFIGINSYGYIVDTIATNDNNQRYFKRVYSMEASGNEALLTNDRDTQFLIQTALDSKNI